MTLNLTPFSKIQLIELTFVKFLMLRHTFFHLIFLTAGELKEKIIFKMGGWSSDNLQ